ncbi:MAG: glycoside hydrolase family 5 protein, partial [Clostridiales bacterium]|nr:glycoside hydrolase family 5 protein [Clostridiales bacterium]
NLTDEHESANGITTRDNGQMRTELTSADFMEFMGQGWNLGNTLEATAAEGISFDTAEEYEVNWGMPLTTQEMIDGIKAYGVNTVRIPVAWSNMMSDDGTYTIDDKYFDRVEEVINYVLNDEMYAIIDIHYDGAWWSQFSDADESVQEQAWARYESFWTQIANRYEEYSDRLIFESANEFLEDGLNDSGLLSEDECYDLMNEINQDFVDIVRSTGGNNAYRYLLIAGYNADIDMTCDDRFVMPTDTDENGHTKLSVSVHYYTPSTYCISESASNSWGYDDTWGTDEDIETMHDNLDKMKKFTDDGYGVIIGEYGVVSSSKDGVPDFIREVMTYGAECGYVPVLWDKNQFFDRESCQMRYSDIAEVFNEVTGANGPVSDDMDTTGLTEVSLSTDDDLTLVYTWEGTWERTSTGSDGGYTETSCDDGLTVQSNAFFWQLFLTADWSGFSEPYIKVTAGDDATSQSADLQLFYTDKADGSWNHEEDYSAADGWSGSCIALNLDYLTGDESWIGLTTNTLSGQFVKIEIYDKR